MGRGDIVPPGPADDDELEERLSRPDAGVLRALQLCPGNILVLGAGGKMGPSLTRMLRRAAADIGDGRKVIAVSRFQNGKHMAAIDAPRIACDLADPEQVRSLPDAPNIIFMAGQKFGTQHDPSATWAMNAAVPAIVASRFTETRFVVFSTGNVYPLTSTASAGSRESDPLAPVGEYAESCVARERIFSYYSARRACPLSIVRLNYAVDLRYGVLVDVAVAVRSGIPIDLRMGYVNVIWQGDANARAIGSLMHAAIPPFVANVTGSERISVRSLAERFAAIFGCAARFVGEEAPDALLSDTGRMQRVLGAPAVPLDWMIAWVAAWITSGGSLLGKPTQFGTRDGSF